MPRPETTSSGRGRLATVNISQMAAGMSGPMFHAAAGGGYVHSGIGGVVLAAEGMLGVVR